MDAIYQTTRNTEQTIIHFAEQSRDIGAILEVIGEITDQSALLALNASIIAAQAGSHGRGFSVIADEMRNLANGMETSRKDIARIVQNVQQEANVVVGLIHDSMTRIAEGVTLTQDAQERLHKIFASAQRSASVVTEIAETLDGQRQTSHQMMQALTQVHAMTTEITASTTQEKTAAGYIRTAIEQVAEKAAQTMHASLDQLDDVKKVLSWAEVIKTLVDQNLASSQHIHQTTTAVLTTHSHLLLQSVDRFTLEESQ